jgi:ariadne-1
MYQVNFAGYISAAVSSGPGCLSLRCPDPSCGAMVLQGMIDKLAKYEDKEKYARFVLRTYIEDSKKVKCLNLPLFPHPTVILSRLI